MTTNLRDETNPREQLPHRTPASEIRSIRRIRCHVPPSRHDGDFVVGQPVDLTRSISRSVASVPGVALEHGLHVRRLFGGELLVQVEHLVMPRYVSGRGELDFGQ